MPNSLTSSQVASLIRVEPGEFKAEALRIGGIQIPTGGDIALTKGVYFEQPNVFELEFLPGNTARIPGDRSHGVHAPAANSTVSLFLQPNDARDDYIAPGQQIGSNDSSVPTVLNSLIQSTTFVFDAQRYNIGRRAADTTNRLSPNGDNLPNMLLILNRDHGKMERFQALVREVLPFIQRVVVSLQGTDIEISVQSDPSLRADLAIPLDECGTGVAQIVSIIYVLVAYRSAQIFIDEPGSFLHPGATRRLIQVMRRFPEHQFFATTHAADVIAAARPEKLLVFRWEVETGSTSITADSGDDVEHLRSSLAELGASVADVFGYDAVVFVEGPTEAACFPLLVPVGFNLAVNFIPMREASRFATRATGKAEAIFDMYRSGVDGSGLMPPKTRFSFDADLWPQREMEDLKRSGSNGLSAKRSFRHGFAVGTNKALERPFRPPELVAAFRQRRCSVLR